MWLLAGDTVSAARLVGLTATQRTGGDADAKVVARWLDEGVAANGACGRAFGKRSVHGFDLTFCAPKSVSLIRAVRGDDVVQKAVADAHATAIAEAMEYLAAHAGYTRVHNAATGEKDLVRLPGLVAIAYQHETSQCGDPHLHTHVIVPNRQARADRALVSIDGTSLFHEARAAGMIARRESAALTRRLRRAKFEEPATFEDFEFTANPKLPAAMLRDLAALRWLDAGESVILYGPVGVGKSHVAQALGHAVARRGGDVRFAKTSRVLSDLAGGHADRSWGQRIRDYTKPLVLILDDFAMREHTAMHADDLYELISDRAVNSKPLILTSNRAPTDWYNLFPNPVVAEFILISTAR